jgi:hypothetical protein
VSEDAYCSTSDLLIGDIPTPDYVNVQKFVDDAADEIDSKIGFVYETRVDMTEGGHTSRPARLLLKRINAFLASGRLLMSVDTGGEDTQVHAYALKLVNDATEALSLIANGQITLEGAEKIASGSTTDHVPIIYNKDTESNVDAFYDRIANPDYVFMPAETHWPHYGAAPDSLVRE